MESLGLTGHKKFEIKPHTKCAVSIQSIQTSKHPSIQMAALRLHEDVDKIHTVANPVAAKDLKVGTPYYIRIQTCDDTLMWYWATIRWIGTRVLPSSGKEIGVFDFSVHAIRKSEDDSWRKPVHGYAEYKGDEDDMDLNWFDEEDAAEEHMLSSPWMRNYLHYITTKVVNDGYSIRLWEPAV